MTYFKPDRFNTCIITWSVRITILCIGISVASLAASFAVRALMLLGGTLLTFASPIIAAIAHADPMIQLALEVAVFIVLLAISTKLFLAIMASQGLERAIA